MARRCLQIFVLLVVALLSVPLQIAFAAGAQYTVTELPTLGGTVGAADSINDTGLIAGYANLAGDTQEHAVLWVNGAVTDLRTLGGPNSSAGFPSKNNQGLIAGISQTAASDPLREGWNYTCTPRGKLCQGKNLITNGFVWQNGIMTPLLPSPLSGGNISEAFGINNSGQVVGFAETGTQDPTCVHPQVQDYEAVVWDTNGNIQASLPPYGSDKISVAVAINDVGQVVGGSGPCAPLSPAIGAHALLWQKGSTIPLPSLGGSTYNAAFAINGQGQIVGISGLTGNITAHAVLWQNGGSMTDLGTLRGDVLSIAYSINDAGQVVGQSCDAKGNCRAFVWQNGAGMLDLNSLVAPGSPSPVVALDINNQGQIVGEAYDQSTGEAPGFLAIPQ